jgi:hypothetical protein
MADSSSYTLDLINTALAAYQTYHNTRPVDFKNPGLTPEQQQLYGLFFKSLTNPTLANNAGDVSNYGRSILGGYSNLGWQAPKTTTGEVGYGGHAPVNFDWSKLPGGGGGGMAPQAPSAPGVGAPTSGVVGDPFGHLSAPAGSPGDPFTGLPYGQGGGGGGGLADFFNQHPGILAGGVSGAAGILASMLGIPAGVASMLVAKYLQSHGQAPPPLPIKHNDVSADNLRPAGMPPPREQLPGRTDAQRSGDAFINSQNIGLGSSGWMAPEGQGQMQPGFGNGLTYNAFYGSNGDPSWNAPNYGSPFGRGGRGQRV